MKSRKTKSIDNFDVFLSNLVKLSANAKLKQATAHKHLIKNIHDLSRLCEQLPAQIVEKVVFNQLQYWSESPEIDYAKALGANEEALIFYNEDGDVHACTVMFDAYSSVFDALIDFYDYQDENNKDRTIVDFVQCTTEAISSSSALLHVLVELADMDRQEEALQLAEKKIQLIDSTTTLYDVLECLDSRDRLNFILHVEARWNMQNPSTHLKYRDLLKLTDIVAEEHVFDLLNTHQHLLTSGAKTALAINKLTSVDQCGHLLVNLKSKWEAAAISKATAKRQIEASSNTGNQDTKKHAKTRSKSVMFAHDDKPSNAEIAQITLRSGRSYGN